jgi:uncharacterized protein YutE (UPF0331/DUF86 family)
MVNERVVLDRLQTLQSCIHRPEPYREWTMRRLTEGPMTYAGVLHHLQLAAQIVLGVSAHLNSALQLEPVSGYGEAIRNLGRAGVLPRDFSERLAELAGFRNVLVHEYLTVDPLRVQEALDEGLDDLRAFIVYVTDFLKEEGTIQRE